MLFTKYILFVISFATLALLFLWLKKTIKSRKIRNLYSSPLSSEYIRLLEKHVPLSRKIPNHLTALYHGHINYFLHSKEFVGRSGFEINDIACLTIAGNACLMVLNRNTTQNEKEIFPGFKTIIVYPETYKAHSANHENGLVSYDVEHRAGESWYRGPIVLSWSDVDNGSKNQEDARNVVIHEFAHKLDEENSLMDGLPILKERHHYQEWAEVLTEEYESFLDRVERGKNDVIDSYGAVSPVEFFAVISESFFEKPTQMKKKLPALYEQLSRYFGLDTAGW